MRRTLFAAFLLPPFLAAQSAPAKPQAELKLGSGVEKLELVGEASEFKVPSGTRIYVWAKITGAADSNVTVVFNKGDKSSRQELKVPRSPYRTHAYRTFRTGDDGTWTVKLLGEQDAELGSASFKVAIQ
jgi:hypothetical protein